MMSSRLEQRSLARLQANPLDLCRLNAPEAARALFGFLQGHFKPGDECSLWSPAEAKSRGYSSFWRVSWEAGPAEWGALLTLGESMWLRELELGYEHRPEVLLQVGRGWYTEPHYGFDVGFVEDQASRCLGSSGGVDLSELGGRPLERRTQLRMPRV